MSDGKRQPGQFDAVIVFGEDWGGLPSSTQHLIRHLPGQPRVLWVNSIGLRAPRLTAYDLIRIWKKLFGIASSVKAMEPVPPLQNMTVHFPRVLPWHGWKLVRKLNGSLLAKTITAYCKQNNVSHAVLWLSLPTALCAVDELKDWPVLYYCCDDFNALAGVDHAMVMPLEKELANRADCIVVSSSELAGKFPEDKTHLIPHGVDVEHFSSPKACPADMPAGEKIAGFYGSIASWLDVELLGDVAIQLSDWQFVFIGNVAADMTDGINTLAALPNVHMLGPRAYSELPAYVQHWQVAMLPFVINQQIKACNPLKLREYLASGTPVVSTIFPQAEKYRDCIQLAENAEDFASALERARVDTQEQESARLNRVTGEGWSNRGAELVALLNDL